MVAKAKYFWPPRMVSLDGMHQQLFRLDILRQAPDTKPECCVTIKRRGGGGPGLQEEEEELCASPPDDEQLNRVGANGEAYTVDAKLTQIAFYSFYLAVGTGGLCRAGTYPKLHAPMLVKVPKNTANVSKGACFDAGESTQVTAKVPKMTNSMGILHLSPTSRTSCCSRCFRRG
jgi:hypothetical protein